jgi:Nif-specific regulatory protein
MPQDPGPDENTRLRRECDLYRRLLALGGQNEIEPFLADALRLVAEVAGAHQGYLEICGSQRPAEQDSWSMSHGFTKEELEGVRATISSAIVAQALETGRTIVTQSAIRDPRFQTRESVQMGKIEAVLCAPIGEAPPIGVLYLQRRVKPGQFTEEDQERVELVARHLVPYADRLLIRQRAASETDPTRGVRKMIRCDGVVGRSAALAGLLREVALVSPVEVNVLLTGESGTGKSQIARVIHDNGQRSSRPFVDLNCASFPEGLLESELFGAVRGGHSTATGPIQGKVAAAERGTLFLDEISALSLTAQAKLLQLLQSKIYYPIGSARPVVADIRVIAASNVDLDAAVRQHEFREDLLYRLRVLPIRVPTLAERREDIPELAAFFCATACERHSLPRLVISPGALHALEAMEWPGNIRQLGNVVEAGAIRAAAFRALQVERAHLFPDTGSPAGESLADEKAPGETRATFQELTRRYQERLLRETLSETDWNVSDAARILDLTRSHVYGLMKAFGVERAR